MMSQVPKVSLKIIHGRIYEKCEENSNGLRFRFKNSLVLVKHNGAEIQRYWQEIIPLFHRLQESNRLHTIWKADGNPKENRIPNQERRIISHLYWNQKTVVRCEGEISEEIQMKKVRLGCVLFPAHFNVYLESIFNETLTRENGIKIIDKHISNTRRKRHSADFRQLGWITKYATVIAYYYYARDRRCTITSLE